MPEAFIGAGSNAEPERRLRLALAELERRFGPVRSSSVYRGPAVGVAAPDYLNVVVALDTRLEVDSLRDELRAIEALAGRTRVDAAVCELDLDLLLYGSRVDAERRVPRPGLLTLPFVLVPLAELAPALPHPVTGERLGDAWARMRTGAPRLHRLGKLASIG
jgi:2-amino-4-hydroxy-6-hydroxymethyldihydropteridine diphosphokinase